MLKDLTKPLPIPPEKTMQERIMEMYEKSAPTAFTVMFSLLMSPKDELKFNAAREILNKIVPDKMNDSFAFLSKKSEEELVALISGSGAFEQIGQLLAASRKGFAEPAIEAGAGASSEIDPGAAGESVNP